MSINHESTQIKYANKLVIWMDNHVNITNHPDGLAYTAQIYIINPKSSY